MIQRVDESMILKEKPTIYPMVILELLLILIFERTTQT